MQDRTPAITVVIPTYGRATKLTQLLQRLSRQTLPPERFECIVVDDGSPEPVQLDEQAYPFSLQLLRKENGGPGSARNRAIPETKAPLTLYLNDDSVPAEDLLEQHLAAQAATPEKTLILGTFPFTEDAQRSPFTHLLQQTDLLFTFSGLREGVDLGWMYCWTCNLSVPTQALRDSGGFDMDLFRDAIVEDVELGYRLEQMGYAIRHFADCRAEHDHVLSIESYLNRMELLGFNLAQMWSKHGEAQILWSRDQKALENVLTFSLDNAIAQLDTVPHLIESLRGLETLLADKPLTEEMRLKLVDAIRSVSKGPWHEGVHRACTAVACRSLALQGPTPPNNATLVLIPYESEAATVQTLESLRQHADPARPLRVVVYGQEAERADLAGIGSQANVGWRTVVTDAGDPAREGVQGVVRGALRDGPADLICFVEGGSQVGPEWLERLQFHAEVDPEVGSVGCLQHDPHESEQPAAQARRGRPAQPEPSPVLLVPAKHWQRLNPAALAGATSCFPNRLRAGLVQLGLKERQALDVVVRKASAPSLTFVK